MGFDALFFARLDNDDRQQRRDKKEMEFVWMPYPDSLGKDVRLFTHVLYDHYSAPQGFDFEIDSGNFFLTNKNSKDFNAEEQSQALLKVLDERSKHYLTDDLFVVFGDDFKFKAASWYFGNLDAMIDYVNANYGDKYFLKYSTPSEYVDAINAKEVAWPTKYDDLFPYASGNTDFWTGYFTSRANAKGYIRTASSNLHSSATLYALKMFDQSADANTTKDILEANYDLRDTLGVL